jgi:hypothetical protein
MRDALSTPCHDALTELAQAHQILGIAPPHGLGCKRDPRSLPLERPWVGGKVQEDSGQLGGCEPVGHRVMELFDNRHPLFTQSIDESELPQRPLSVKGYFEQLRALPTEFTLVPGCRQMTQTNMFGDVEVRIVAPDQWSFAEQTRGCYLSELWHLLETTGDQASYILQTKVALAVLEVFPFEYSDRRHMHRRGFRFHVDERGVERRERVSMSHV